MSKKPLLYTAIAAPVAAIVSIPLAFIAGALALIFLETDWGHVYPGDATIGFVVGGVTMLIFALYVSYATYSFTSEKYGSAN